MSIFVLDNIGRMAEEKNQKVIRISSVADGKLSEIAKRNHLSKSKAASRIINHYYASNIGVDMPSSEDFSRMVNVLSNLDGKYSKLIGPVERTEDFIKSLVRETRNDESDPYIMESKDAQPGVLRPSQRVRRPGPWICWDECCRWRNQLRTSTVVRPCRSASRKKISCR